MFGWEQIYWICVCSFLVLLQYTFYKLLCFDNITMESEDTHFEHANMFVCKQNEQGLTGLFEIWGVSSKNVYLLFVCLKNVFVSFFKQK